MTVAVINAMFRAALDDRLPGWIEPRWAANDDEVRVAAPEAEIGWIDGAYDHRSTLEALVRAGPLKWLHTAAAGVDPFPLELMRRRGIVLTNAAGINAITIAEFAVMGMLAIAKGYREVVRAQDRHEWLDDAPGKRELRGTKALIVGAGGIGGRIGMLLRPFGVEVTEVRRRPREGALGPDEWRGRLGEFDWVVIAVPSTPDTAQMFGAAEFAAMRPGAVILNFARGKLIDTDALVAALNERRIGGAFLDVTDPEPLPADHPLWGFDNVHLTMHLSGRSQDTLIRRSADRFIENLERWNRGAELISVVNLGLGY